MNNPAMLFSGFVTVQTATQAYAARRQGGYLRVAGTAPAFRRHSLLGQNMVSLEEAQRLMIYDPFTGDFKNRISFFGRRGKAGESCGDIVSRGRGFYRRLSVGGQRFYAHRVAWWFFHGQWPTGVIDHINGNGLDNRIDNLRDVDCSTNLHNQHVVRRDNSTGYSGVGFDKRRSLYRAAIQIDGAAKFLGYFKTAKEAHQAYQKAKIGLASVPEGWIAPSL